MPNSEFWIRITCLYVSQTPPVVLRMQNILLISRMTLVYWSQPSSVVLCIQNSAYSIKSLLVPALIYHFCMQNSDFRTRITSLYCSHNSPVISCMQNSVISTRISCLHGSQPSSVVLFIQNREFSTRISSLYGSLTSTVDL